MKNLFENWRKHLGETASEYSNEPKVVCRCLCTDCVFNTNQYCTKEDGIELEKRLLENEDRWICECVSYEVRSKKENTPQHTTLTSRSDTIDEQ